MPTITLDIISFLLGVIFGIMFVFAISTAARLYNER